MMIADAATRAAQTSSAQLIGRLIFLAVCVISGGIMGLSRLKSSTPGREGPSANAGLG